MTSRNISRTATMILAAGLLTACGAEQDASSVTSAPAGEQPIAIAIHGGAGTITRENMSPEREAAFTAALTAATQAGYRVLEAGGSALDAIEAAILLMEEEPLFNAGVGSVYTYEGGHELDASVMIGNTMDAGAVAGVRTIRNPILAARAVMEQSRHVMLSGAGAEDFSVTIGLEQVENSFFNTEQRYQQLQRALERLREQQNTGDQIAKVEGWDPAFNMGTVGAVAVDRHGNLAAGTSTGGMTAKQWGRIGDAPIIGAGTWADNESCAVSATGHGEYFIRYHVAADVCSRVKYQGLSIEEAGRAVIHDVLLPAGGTGGVIIVDRAGNISMPFNTEGMYRASKNNSGELVIGIYREE
ncbi:MAG: isoaspartyl peptidase/L-asparaginase [Idiomarina sp.]|nr:isoaspartyl peptidase/L-asparaginase [Idiomarina sp.]